MTSLRAQLQKMGHPADRPLRYGDFHLRPERLSLAMRAMESPGEFHAVGTKADRELDESWTQECQGIAWVGTHWILSSNGSEWGGGGQVKALYTFNASTKFRDEDVVHRFVINNTTVPRLGGGIFHVGDITWQDGTLHVDHWNPDEGGQILRFDVTDGVPSLRDIIPLRFKKRGDRVGLIAVNRWGGGYLTCSGEINVDRLHIHDERGVYTGRDIPLDPPITDGGYAQGGFFSPNGNIYIASGRRGIKPHQYIYGYRALTGRRFATIPVVAEGRTQELEGCSFASVVMDGQPVQIVAVLLENNDEDLLNISISKDDAYIKAFAAERPEYI